jgi:GT2 family glycosyltransferase
VWPSSARRRLERDLTVVMKTFHRPRTAALAVEHLRRRYPEIRLLVADDGRAEFAFEHERAEVVRLPFDSGISAGRNALLARVETGFFVLMDDDHFFSRRTRLERMLAMLEAGGYDILACHVYRRRPTQRLFPKRRLDGFFLDLRVEGDTLVLLEPSGPQPRGHRACDAVENFFVARTERVRAMGGWDERLKVAEHLDFFMRAKRAGLKVGYTPRAAVDHVHIHRERTAPAYAEFRGTRQAQFRRIWFETHGIRRLVDRDGTSVSAEEWIRRGDWPVRAARASARSE